MSNALSLYFPNDPPTPTTIQHILNLPPLVQSISPSLSSLHLARIRLAFLVKPGTLDQTAWCRTCGELRQPVRSRDETPTGPSPRRRRNGKNRTSSSGGSGSGTGTTKRRAALPRKCGRCGTSFTRPRIDEEARSFPSARTLRATRSTRNVAPEICTPAPVSVPKVTDTVMTDNMESLAAIEGFPASVNPNTPPPSESEPSFDLQAPPARYVHSNSAAHIHNSIPNLPTYPQPPAKHNVPPPKGKGKKRGQSGLAKLLAENEERQSGGGSARGSWGLE